MRELHHLLAAAAISSLVLSAAPGSAGPLASGPSETARLPELSEGLVQKAHGSHCRKRKGWYRGKRQWHRHWRACRVYDYSYHPHNRRYPPRPYYGYGEFGFPYDEWQWERRNWLWD